jgi:RNA polymerase sigma factor (sigma-70 family)
MARLQLDTAVHQLRRLAGPAGPANLTDEQLLDAFTRRRDEGAFATLVGRYSGLVMGVCQRALGHRQDAEDAFQASFLVLARHAESIRKRQSLAAFLHGVAHRIARNAKRSLARQRHRDQAAARAESVVATEDLSWREVQTLLDEEVQQLPEVYRQVFVLCCLEGLSKPEAARQLGLKEGTVASRLARARGQLKERLAERGVTLSTLMAALDLGSETAQVGAAAVRTTAEFAVAYAAGACVCSAVPAQVAALADGVTPVMLFTKTKIATALVLLAGLLAATAGLLFAPLSAQPPATEKEKTDAKKIDPKPGEIVGRVVGPDGKAVKGARIFQVVRQRMEDQPATPAKLLAQSDADGKFQAPRPAVKANPPVVWMAVAAGFGPAVVEAKTLPARGEATLKLVEDVPIAGRVVNLEGKPVPGVTIRPFVLGLPAKGDLKPFLAAVEAKKPVRVEEFFPDSIISPAGVPGLPVKLTTDADGRFRLNGVGRERTVALQVSGPKIENDLVMVMTRAGKSFLVPDSPGSNVELRVYPATFQHVASPPRPLLGTVRDRHTGQPIAGVGIEIGMGPFLRPTTKKDGTYRLDSLPSLVLRPSGPRGEIQVMAVPSSAQPYLPALKGVRLGSRSEPLRADFTLVRGLWTEGRVTDKQTGKAVQANIEYCADIKNPALKDYVDRPSPERLFVGLYRTKADGSYRIPVLPGAGAIVARVMSGDYLGDESLDEDQAAQLGLPTARTLAYFNAVRRIDARVGETVKCDLVVDPGQTLTCELLDPDNKPVRGARVAGVGQTHYWGQPLVGTSITLKGLHPNRPRWLAVLHPGRQLGATMDVKPGEKEPYSIRLERTGTITGRLLDPDGDVWKQQDLQVFYHKPKGTLYQHLPNLIRTDDQGRFRVEGVIPGLIYQVVVAGKQGRTIGSVKTGLSPKPGEVKDLGDVKARLFP